MEYYLAIKRNKLLIHTKTWMNLIGIMLSERSQSQRVTYGMIPLTQHSPKDKTIEMDNRSMIVRVEGRGEYE